MRSLSSGDRWNDILRILPAEIFTTLHNCPAHSFYDRNARGMRAGSAAVRRELVGNRDSGGTASHSCRLESKRNSVLQ
jgi:hypothetical protein